MDIDYNDHDGKEGRVKPKYNTYWEDRQKREGQGFRKTPECDPSTSRTNTEPTVNDR